MDTTQAFTNAYNYAKANPDTDYATELRKRIEAGQYNKEIKASGIVVPGLQKIVNDEVYNKEDTGADLKQIGTDISTRLQTGREEAKKTVDSLVSGEIGLVRGGVQAVKQAAGFATGAFADTLKGLVKAVLPQAQEDQIKEGVGKIAVSAMDAMSKYEELQKTNPTKAKVVNLALGGTPNAVLRIEDLIKGYERLKVTNPFLADTIGAGLNIVSLAADITGLGEIRSLAKGGIRIGTEAVTDLAKGVKSTASEVASSASGGMASLSKGVDSVATSVGKSGVGQIASELAERVPRAVTRVQETVAEASARAERIKSSTPATQKAIKSNLDERIINTVNQADDATKQAYKEVIDIAEESPKTIGTKKQPTIVGGELANKQYDIINKQKQLVGKKIGDTAKQLSKTEKVAMQDSFTQMDDVLANQGITPVYTKKGVKLDFSGSKYTPAERKKIQELYDLATEGGDTLTPSQIRGKDQLFSKLKRESQYEGVGDLIIETAEGNKSLFNVFRDIYSSKLDTISPEMKALNNQYRKLSQITDDIEDSIFKTPNYNVTKSVDPAEFAKVNLRRIFGEAQSSPVYEAVADAMDTLSRKLGYKGASPKVVAEFAQEMRKLFPDTIPKTGFTGGIRAGLGDIVEQISKVGAPNLKDQQKALRELLDSYFTSKKNMIKPKTNPKAPTSAVKSQTNSPKATKATKVDISTSIPKTVKKSSVLLTEAKKYKSAEEYMYHGTSEGAFRKIREKGLIPEKISSDTQHVYFGDKEARAKYYAGAKGGNVYGERVLRVKKTPDMKADPRMNIKGDFRTEKAISPENIEIKINGKWKPIQDYFDESINIMPIKTRSQLTNIYNKAKVNGLKVKGTIPENSLISEAKKYKSAEEFVKAQGAPVYHGTNTKFDVFDKTKIGEATGTGDWGDGFYFSDSKDVARSFAKDAGGDVVMEVNLKNLKFADGNKLEKLPEVQNILDDGMGFADIGEYVKLKGYDGVKYKHSGDGGVEYVVYDADKIKTKSQLTDIWKKANNK